MARMGHEVSVTCDKRYYDERTPTYLGVRRLFLPIPANGVLSPLHDLVAFAVVFARADAIIVLGVSAGPLFIVMRFLTSLFGKRLLVNIDGVEWRRRKYSSARRFMLRIFDFIGQLSASALIYDNPGLRTFVWKAFRGKAFFIAYPGDHARALPGRPNTQLKGALTICRIEPENNIEMLIDGALGSSIEKYTIVGNWANSNFGRRLKSKYRNEPRLCLLEPIYEPEVLVRYRESCEVYLHGHSVGGTNPSLVEMLFYDCAILCFDCEFNRHTAKDGAAYFNSAADLSKGIDRILSGALSVPRRRSIDEYKADNIASQYIALAERGR